MSPIKNIYFLLFSIIYLLIKTLQLSGVDIPIVHDYFADLLCIPIVLSICLALLQLLYSKYKYRRLELSKVVFAVIYVAIVFELFLPFYSSTYTGDIIDVAAYCIGGVIFQLTINKPKKVAFS